MTAKHLNLTRILFFLGCFIFSVACTGATQTDYTKLCQIYARIVPQPLELYIKEGKIAERIQLEMPKFFKDNFVNIMLADADQRYQFIRQLAETETKTKWGCDIIRLYYANDFSKPSQQK